MRLIGIETIYPKRNLSRPHPGHKIYPYLLRNRVIGRVNQAWGADITCIRMKHGWLYLLSNDGLDEPLCALLGAIR
jgi:putative transposase